ncbi:hypothetical protein L484_012244 [Morus notabilis]|uniref:Uncharacterized protein n=1 Tax=Morus notabilis TaxID=981085 RepID=W9QZJ6_9ROSA|nr:hypothetical protein L484_012244 [Morus notabilis]
MSTSTVVPQAPTSSSAYAEDPTIGPSPTLHHGKHFFDDWMDAMKWAIFDQNAQIREGPRREGHIRAGFGLEYERQPREMEIVAGLRPDVEMERRNRHFIIVWNFVIV